MIDMSKIIETKSDQLNAIDLIGGPETVVITGVKLTGAADQPVAISYEGDNGKPYKPGLSMRRVMVAAWGVDASKYVGRSMTLYCDNSVRFGGMDVGGIRISHMSHLPRAVKLALTVTRGKKAAYTVQPLDTQEVASTPPELLTQAAEFARAGRGQFLEYWKALNEQDRAALKPHLDDLKAITEEAAGE